MSSTDIVALILIAVVCIGLFVAVQRVLIVNVSISDEVKLYLTYDKLPYIPYLLSKGYSDPMLGDTVTTITVTDKLGRTKFSKDYYSTIPCQIREIKTYAPISTGDNVNVTIPALNFSKMITVTEQVLDK